MKKRYSRQQKKKLSEGKCFLCGETNYNVLHAHRIIEGGTYHPNNVLVLCANCHSKTHSGEVKFDRKYYSTTGQWVVHMFVDQKEYWISEPKGFSSESNCSER